MTPATPANAAGVTSPKPAGGSGSGSGSGSGAGAAGTPATPSGGATPSAGSDKDKDVKGADKEKEKEKEKEPDSEVLKNPARVTAAQQPLITYDKAQRYIPVKSRLWGIVILKDGKPDEGEELVVTSAPKIGIPGISDDEPEPPEPFEFLRN